MWSLAGVAVHIPCVFRFDVCYKSGAEKFYVFSYHGKSFAVVCMANSVRKSPDHLASPRLQQLGGKSALLIYKSFNFV